MSCFIGFRGKGFWCSESAAGLLAGLLAEHLRSISTESWATDYAAVLDLEATSTDMGCMSFHMDKFLGNDHYNCILSEAVLATIGELAAVRSIPMDRIRTMPYAKNVTPISPTPTDSVLRYAIIMFLMLQGRWAGDESSTLS